MRDYDLTQPKCPGFAGENGKAGRQRRAFIRQRGYARIRDHSWGTTGEDNPSQTAWNRSQHAAYFRKVEHFKKKPSSQEPGLRYWPREADTITFQEGLLNIRATGGGGQMCNAKAQRKNIMSRPGALQQPRMPHVSHAETRGLLTT